MKHLNSSSAANYLGITTDQLRELRYQGILLPAGYHNGNQPLYSTSDLDAFAERLGFQREYVVEDEVITVLDDEGLRAHIDRVLE